MGLSEKLLLSPVRIGCTRHEALSDINLLTKLPFVREFFVNPISCILTKHN